MCVCVCVRACVVLQMARGEMRMLPFFSFFGLALKKLSSETDLLVIDDDNRLACSIKKSDKLGKRIAEKLQIFSTTKF